jgi:hypothetical protein
MSIQIKELLPSDALSQAVEKLNYNFDQLILAGGGPEGPRGLQGIIGPNGVQGDRGSIWYESPTGGTVGANVPSTIFIEDKILDSDGVVWEYNGTTWVDTTINLTGPTGAAGNAGAGGEFLRYAGDYLGNSWVPKANGAQTPITTGNSSPNFFGFYDVTTPAAQGIDSFIFGHNQDVTDSTNLGATGDLPKMVILQSNPFGGISIGLGSTFSTQAITTQVDFNTHAQIYKDGTGILKIKGSKGATGINSEVSIEAKESGIKLNTTTTRIEMGYDGSSFSDDISISADRITHLYGGNEDSSIHIGVNYNSSDNNFYTTVGDDIIINPKTELAIDGNTYIKGVLSIRGSQPAGDYAEGIRIYTSSTDNKEGYIRVQNNNTPGSNFDDTYMQIQAETVRINSQGNFVNINNTFDERVIIGDDPNNSETIGFVASEDSSNSRWGGIFDAGTTATSVRWYVGVDGGDSTQTYRSNRHSYTDFVKGAFDGATDGYGDRLETNITGRRTNYSSGTRIGSRTLNLQLGSVNVTDSINTIHEGIVSIGGLIKFTDIDGARIEKMRNHDRLNLWGGIRFKGRSNQYDNLTDERYTNVGYHYSDMMFYAGNQTPEIDPNLGHDIAQDQERATIFFGSPVLRSDGVPVNGDGIFPKNELSDANQSFVNFYNNSNEIKPAIGIWTDESYRADMGIWTIASTKHSGLNGGREFLIDAIGTHATLRAGTAGTDINIFASSDIKLKADTNSIYLDANDNVEITAETNDILLDAADQITLKTSDNDTTNGSIYLRHVDLNSAQNIHNIGIIRIRHTFNQAADRGEGAIWMTPNDTVGAQVSVGNYTGSLDQTEGTTTNGPSTFRIRDSSGGNAPWSGDEKADNRGRMEGNWHMWDNEWDQVQDWTQTAVSNSTGANSFVLTKSSVDGLVTLTHGFGSGAVSFGIDYTATGTWELNLKNYDRIIYVIRGGNDPVYQMRENWYLTDPYSGTSRPIQRSGYIRGTGPGQDPTSSSIAPIIVPAGWLLEFKYECGGISGQSFSDFNHRFTAIKLGVTSVKPGGGGGDGGGK